MGIRIHKVLGYGLTNVATRGGQISDPRINPSSHMLEYGDPGQSYQDFLKSIAAGGDKGAKAEQLMLKMLSEKDVDTNWLCTWDGEYGLPNVLVVRPVGFPQWRRYDDPIDYEEEILRGDHPEPRVVRTPGGLYPFNGSHMDIRSGERIQGNAVNAWCRVVNDEAGATRSAP